MKSILTALGMLCILAALSTSCRKPDPPRPELYRGSVPGTTLSIQQILDNQFKIESVVSTEQPRTRIWFLNSGAMMVRVPSVPDSHFDDGKYVVGATVESKEILKLLNVKTFQ